MKIAVPVEDKELRVAKRVGRAPYFAIFEDGKFIELRENLHSKTHHHTHGRGKHKEEEGFEEYSEAEVKKQREDLKNIADVNKMYVRAVGPNMKEALESIGIEVVRTRKKDGEFAGEIISFLGN